MTFEKEMCGMCGKLVNIALYHAIDRRTGRVIHYDCTNEPRTDEKADVTKFLLTNNINEVSYKHEDDKNRVKNPQEN